MDQIGPCWSSVDRTQSGGLLLQLWRTSTSNGSSLLW
jgi:hypothetical protein